VGARVGLLNMLDNIDVLIRNWVAGYGWPIESLARLLLAAVAGGLVGLEREIRGRQAGFRTNLLVCLGSALVMIVSTRFAGYEWDHEPGVQIAVDPARIAYGVMTGIGFLGAGTIIQSGGSVRGLTTAAALWCVAAVGLAAGFGLYVVAMLASLLILLALWLLDYVEEILPRTRYRTVIVRRRWQVGCIAETVELFKRAKLGVVDVTFERTGDLTHADISVRISVRRSIYYYNFERELERNEDYQLIASREL
jgi:putative Mg2+ transporter-C (MgtC) family protein